MAIIAQPWSLEALPNEILDLIASYTRPHSLVAFATASRKLHAIAKARLVEHKLLYATLALENGQTKLRLAGLLVDLLEDPRKGLYIRRWKVGGHLDEEEDEEDHLRDCENQEEEFSDVEDLIHPHSRQPHATEEVEEPEDDEADDDGTDDDDEADDDEAEDKSPEEMDPEERSEIRKEATRFRLSKLLETSPWVPDSIRDACVKDLRRSNQSPQLHALGISLCPHIEELDMANGEDLRPILVRLPAGGSRRYLAELKNFTASAYGYQEVQNELQCFVDLVEIPRLETVSLGWTFAESDDDFESAGNTHICAISRLELIQCQIQPDALARLLSCTAEPRDMAPGHDAYLGLKSLVYIFGQGMMSSEYVSQSFRAPQIIAAIRENAGQSLESLDCVCEREIWAYAHNYLDTGDEESEMNWSMTRESNLRDGFPRLTEVMLSPDLLVCGWRCPKTTYGYNPVPSEPETVDETVESLPLAVMLPESLEVLKLRDFNTDVFPVAAAIVLEKLVKHLEMGLKATPKLREIHLLDDKDLAGKPLRSSEFGLTIAEFAKLCQAQNIVVQGGQSPIRVPKNNLQ